MLVWQPSEASVSGRRALFKVETIGRGLVLGVTSCSRPHMEVWRIRKRQDCSREAAPCYPQQHWRAVGRGGMGLAFDSLITSRNKGGEQGAKSVKSGVGDECTVTGDFVLMARSRLGRGHRGLRTNHPSAPAKDDPKYRVYHTLQARTEQPAAQEMQVSCNHYCISGSFETVALQSLRH